MDVGVLNSAAQLFNSNQFEDCIKTLRDFISSSSVSDDLVVHNELVARYYYCGDIHASDSILNGFVSLLAEQQKKWDDAKALDDSVEAKYSKQFNQLTSLGKYNCAVLYYRSQYYHKALDILTKFFSQRCLEHFDESLSVKVVLLLFDISFRLKTLDKKITQQSLEILERAAKNVSPSTLANLSSPDPRIIVQCVKAQFCFYFNAFNLAKQEIKLLPDQSNGGAVSLLYRAQVEYLEGSCANAEALLSVFDKYDQPLEILVIYFNNLSCIQLKMEKYASALFYLKQTMAVYKKLMEFSELESENIIPNFNASYLDSYDEREDNSLLERKPKIGKSERSVTSGPNRLKLHSRKSFSISYGMGLAMLHRGKPKHAFQAFQYALQTYYNLPCIWLRLAECCIAHHREKIPVPEEIPSQKKVAKANESKKDASKEKKTQDDDEDPEISLTYGAMCLKNLLRITNALLDIAEEDILKLKDAEQANAKGPNWIQLKEERISQLQSMQIAAYANLCWIGLRLNDPHTTLFYAQEAIVILSGTSAESAVMDKYEDLISTFLSEAKNELNRLG